MDRVTAYAVMSDSYSNPDAFDIILNVGSSVTLEYPNSLYLTVVTSGLNSFGNFAFNYQYVDRDPDDVIASLSDSERLEIVQK